MDICFTEWRKIEKNPQETALSSKGNNKISGEIKKNILSDTSLPSAM